jgi:hypothetical protein
MIISSLKKIFASAVCGTIPRLSCCLFKLAKKYLSVFIVSPKIIIIVGEVEFGVGRNPDV